MEMDNKRHEENMIMDFMVMDQSLMNDKARALWEITCGEILASRMGWARSAPPYVGKSGYVCRSVIATMAMATTKTTMCHV